MKRTATAALAGLALAGLIGVGVAVADDGSGPVGRLSDVLSGLVSAGTITQEQADTVAEALTDARAEALAERDAARTEREAEVDSLLQRVLGKDLDQVRSELASGSTLLEIAGDDAQALADGMLDLLGARLDQAVAEGRLTDDQAATALERATEHADAWVAGRDTGRGGGLGLLLGGMGPRGHGGDLGPGFGMGRGHGPGVRGQGQGHGPDRPGGGWGGPWADGQDTAPASSSTTIAWPI